jgi:hypothetical protein
MKSTQGWGWLTVGVLALGLNGFYHDGGAAWAHRIADRIGGRSEILADVVSERVDGFMERTNLVAARGETSSCRLATSMARVQEKIARGRTGFDRFEAMSAREEAAMARMEEQRARREEQVARVRIASEAFNPVVRVRSVAVVCPRVHVSAPQVPMVVVEGPGPI